jgi:hypothetical protein
LMKKCWNRDPQQRPSFTDIVQILWEQMKKLSETISQNVNTSTQSNVNTSTQSNVNTPPQTMWMLHLKKQRYNTSGKVTIPSPSLFVWFIRFQLGRVANFK